MEMDLEMHNFQQHREVHWLNMGPSIKIIPQQWEALTHLVVELAKDPKTVLESVIYERVYMVLDTKEKAVTQVALEYSNNLIALSEQFLVLFQKSSSVHHLLCCKICDILAKLMMRFMKAQTVDKKYGSDLTTVECKDVKLQLPR